MPMIQSKSPSQSLEHAFREQVVLWKDATGHLSSIKRATSHPSYLRIIGLVRYSSDLQLERLLLNELESEPDHWFAALTAITGANPAGPEDDFDETVRAWLRWGKDQGILETSDLDTSDAELDSKRA